MSQCIFAVYTVRGRVQCPRTDNTREHYYGHTARGDEHWQTECHRPSRWFNPDTGRCDHPEHDIKEETE